MPAESPAAARPGPSLMVLTECYYCGKFMGTPMEHGPGQCRPPLDLAGENVDDD